MTQALAAPTEGSSVTGKQGGSRSVVKALIGRCGTLVLNVGTGILTARTLKPAGRGELAAMILWPIFLSGAFTLGLPSSLLYTLRQKRRPQKVLIATALLLALGLSVITCVLGIVLLPHWLTHYPPTVVRAAQWFMLSTPATIIALVGRSVWEANGRFGTSSAILIAPPAFIVVVLLVLLGTHHMTPTTAATTYVLSGIPPLIWILISLRKDLTTKLGEIGGATKDLMSYGLRSYGIDLCGSLSQYVDQALVLGMLAPSDMGTYTVALSLSRMVNVVFTATASVVFPKAIDCTPLRATQIALRALVGSLALAVPAAVVLILASGFSLRLLYGSEYTVASSLFKLLLLEALLSGSISVMSQPFMALGKPGTVTLLQITGLATAAPLIWFLVPRMGSKGACIALLGSACVRAILLQVCYQRLFAETISMRKEAWTEARSLATTYGRLVKAQFAGAETKAA